MRVCIIGGCGHVGRVLEGIAASKGQQSLCAYSGTQEDRVDTVRAKMEALGLRAPYYENYEDMLEREKPDVCVVDNVFYRHAKAAAFSLSRGIATYCEKPLATTLEELSEVRAAWEAAHAPLWAMQTARYDAWFYTARQLVEQGAIGSVRMLNGQKSYRLGNRPPYYQSRATYGGSIPWVAIHSIDLILSLCDQPVQSVYALHTARENHDLGDLEISGQILLEMADDIYAGVNFDLLRPEGAPTHGDDRIRIAGTQGVLEVRANKVFLIDQSGESEPALLSPPTIWEAFVEYVGGKPGLITPESSLEATRIALLAREAADRKTVQTC